MFAVKREQLYRCNIFELITNDAKCDVTTEHTYINYK